MNLFDINNEITRIIDESVDEDGCILEDKIAELEALQMDRNTKFRNIACMILNLNADAEAYKKQKMIFDKKKSTAENQVKYLKELLIKTMGEDEKFKCDEVSINRRRTEKVIVDDELDVTTLPEGMWKYGKPEAKLTEIKDYIKNGGELEGCKIEVTNNVIIK